MVSHHFEENDLFLGNKYKIFLSKKLGSGAFGNVYEGKFLFFLSIGINTITNLKIAMKIEPANTQHPQLKYECSVLKYLQGGEGIPNIYLYFQTHDSNCLIMECLGKNLENLQRKAKNNFSLKTTVMCGIQMLSRIEYLHKRHVIHRDIKPENFVIGLEDKSNLIHIIDFGLAKRFRDPKTGTHIPYKDGKRLTGTARYASIYTHLGIEQSRRDDLESMIYSLVYLYNGNLPWQGIQAKTKNEKYQKILEKKINVTEEMLCKDMPKEFLDILNYVKKLQFEELPDYSYIKEQFNRILNEESLNLDWGFDWLIEDTASNSSSQQSQNNSFVSYDKLNPATNKTNEKFNRDVSKKKEIDVEH